MYIKPIDETITLFLNTKKEDGNTSNKFLEIKNKYLVTKTITDEINENGKYTAIELFPFGENPYKNINDMMIKIEEESKKEGKKFIYVYDDEPDYSMHDLGADSEKVIKLIKERNEKTEGLCNNLKDTLVIITADHGHIKVENIFLKDYPELINMLERTPSIEQRADSFKVKDNLKYEFKTKFNELLGKYFNLYTKEEVINSNLFGDGKENPLFEDALGDFIAIAKDNKTLVYDDEDVLVSTHAGYTDDEIYVPIIVKYCK